MSKCKVCQQVELLPADKQSGICASCLTRIELAIPGVTKRLDKLENESSAALQAGKLKRFGEVERQLIGVASELAAFERLGVHTAGYVSQEMMDSHRQHHDKQLLLALRDELAKCQQDFAGGQGQAEPAKFDAAARRALLRAHIMEFNTLDPELIEQVRAAVTETLACPPAGYKAMADSLRAITEQLDKLAGAA